MPYVTLTEVRSNAQGMTGSGVPAATDELLNSLIERASRMVDRECGVTEGYFEKAPATATARTFYPSGLNYLKLDPYVSGSLTVLAVPSGYVTPYYVERNGYLVRTGSDLVLPDNPSSWIWNSGVPVTVTAKWGFSATPADIKQAVIEMAINLWRETDPSTAKLVGLDGSTKRENIPPRVREIAKHRRLGEAKAVFA